jgi:uncharacterized phage protein (TIGR01671 family)
MKRVIKFRAWDGEKYVSPDYISRDGFAWWKENSIPTLLDTVEQFTGELDLNKKEIYEGDIVSAFIFADETPQKLSVEYRCGGFLIDYKDSESDTVLIGAFVGSLKVIGNIHENPELLKESTK